MADGGSKPWVHFVGIGVGVALVAYLVSFSDEVRYAWTDRDRVGTCENRTSDEQGGEVLALQSILAATTGFTPADSRWDKGTETATLALQGWTGLDPNGCVEDSTWVTMRVLAVPICAPGRDCGGPDHRVRFPGTEGDPREAWFAHDECDWGTYAFPGVVASPVSSGAVYAFGEDDLVALRCDR
ncbi:hypothetical protein [Antribacter gilvus]|uniref:hypothetical protein n=1 Tax=Antribacter gilvus TaxID=2304675 RepID=UPI000F7B5A32|nr:hypothetical protein [Antribacter gilvus]